MKRLLSLLMCYVFLQAETFALRGGPGASGTSPLSGGYSAILIQTSPLFSATTGQQISPLPGNGIGLVSLVVPASGIAIGNILIFDSQTGDTFLGKANGLSNPLTGELTCLVSGSQFIIKTISTAAGVTGAVTTSETMSGRMVASKSKTRQKAFSGITGTAKLLVAGIPFISVVNGVTVNFIGSGAETTYELVGYQTGGDATLGTFDLNGSN